MKRIINQRERRTPTFAGSLLAILLLVTVLAISLIILEIKLIVALLFSVCAVCLVGMYYGMNFEDITKGITYGIGKATTCLMIFILIGALMGSWIVSGTVPALMYYGIQFINPSIFLPMTFVLCSLTSLCTGTSWGTAGTMGIATMGMGMGLGIPTPWIAGAIVAGSYFGDKMSPISDSTVLAAASADTNVYDHIKAMMYTTVPAFIISIIIYTIMGVKYASGVIDTTEIDVMSTYLAAEFNLNPIVLLPLAILLTLSILKVSAVPAMFLGTLAATIIALTFQGVSLSDALNAYNIGYTNVSNIPLVDSMLIRGGIQSMMSTFSLCFVALCLGGICHEAGFLHILLKGLVKKVKRIGSLVATVICTGALTLASMGESYLGVILNGAIYKNLFKEKGLKPQMLSRLLEEGVTCFAALLPWTAGGAFMTGILGVATFDYLPYAFLNYLTPILSIAFCYLGFSILWIDKDKKDKFTQEKDELTQEIDN